MNESDRHVQSGLFKQQSTQFFLLGCAFYCSFLLTGCGSDSPATVPVSGEVTYVGAPLTSGAVTLHPYEIAAGLPQRPAIGHLNAEGKFQLSTFGPGDGAIPGKYRVTIHSYRTPPDPQNDAALVTHQWQIPSRYGDPATSGLTTEIDAASGNVELHFDLTE